MFLPLFNASLLGLCAIALGYRIKLRRKQPGEVPFWVRFGLISLIALASSIVACVAFSNAVNTYLNFADHQLDIWLLRWGLVSGPIDYGPLLPWVTFIWTLMSGPPLLATCLASILSHRYTLRIERVT